MKKYTYDPTKMADYLKRFNVNNLSEQERTDGARVIVDGCMHVKPGEKFLLIAQNDDQKKLMAKYLEAEARRLGATVTVMYLNYADLGEGMEPPQSIVDEMMKNDVILTILSLAKTQIFAHTKARNKATNEHGARVGFASALAVGGATIEDVVKERQRTDKVANIMERSKIARITSLDGTDVTMNIEGRKCERLRGSMWEKGEWGGVPNYAEAALAPVEGTTNGKYVINGFFEGVGRVTSPFTWIIKDGRILEVVGDGPEAQKCREILAAADQNGTNIAELGVATGHMLDDIGLTGTIMDKMLLGTIHLACGKNTTFVGGKVGSNIHHDGVSTGITLELDGNKIIENGEWLLD